MDANGYLDVTGTNWDRLVSLSGLHVTLAKLTSVPVANSTSGHAVSAVVLVRQ